MLQMIRLTLLAVEVVCDLAAELYFAGGMLRTEELLRVELEVICVVKTLVGCWLLLSTGLELLETNVV